MSVVEWRTRVFCENENGATLIEFTLVSTLFFVAVFGVVEFGFYFWQLSAITKGAEAALRYAVVSNPVTGDWATLQPNSGVVITCRSQEPGSATCSPATQTPSAAAMDCIVGKLKAFASFVQPENVVIEYRANDLGLPGFQAPTVELRLENLKFMNIFLGFVGDKMLPALNYTMTGEDLNSSPPGTPPTGNECGLIS